MNRYTVNIYSGGVYCGNGFFDTIEECIKFAQDEGFIDKIEIYDKETNETREYIPFEIKEV